MVGYARVSTHDQNTALQVDALDAAGCTHIFSDSISGATTSRPNLEEAFRTLSPGDTFVVWKLDRLGRSLRHLIALICELESRGICFRSLSEGIDTDTASGRLLFHVLGALAEFERALISERTRAGIAAARARGRMLGRPSKLTPKQAEEVLVHYRKLRSLSKVARLFSVSPLTIRRAVERRVPA